MILEMMIFIPLLKENTFCEINWLCPMLTLIFEMKMIHLEKNSVVN